MSFIFVLLSVILSVFAFLLNCFHILLCDEKAERVYGTESVETKAFIEFIALILRNRLYTCLKEEMKKNDRKFNFMTVAAALRELEKIEMIRGSDNEYHLDHAVTATQKTILSAFGMDSQDIKKKAQEIGAELARIELEATEEKNRGK